MNSNPPKSPLPIAVLISGTGRSLQNLIEREASGTLDVDFRLVISSSHKALGLEFARQAGIPVEVVERKGFDDDASFGEAIFAAFRKAEVRLVVMAGFLRFVPIPADFENRVINIHPALVPAFCGKGLYGHHVHEAVLEYGAKMSGCTVHFVDNQYDHGPIILQQTAPVADDDTPDTLAARVFEMECEALPAAIQRIAEGRVQVHGRRVRISAEKGSR